MYNRVLAKCKLDCEMINFSSVSLYVHVFGPLTFSLVARRQEVKHKLKTLRPSHPATQQNELNTRQPKITLWLLPVQKPLTPLFLHCSRLVTSLNPTSRIISKAITARECSSRRRCKRAPRYFLLPGVGGH